MIKGRECGLSIERQMVVVDDGGQIDAKTEYLGSMNPRRRACSPDFQLLDCFASILALSVAEFPNSCSHTWQTLMTTSH